MNRKVYISGPISGLEREEVEASFSMAESVIRDLGHIPVSPLQNGLSYDAPWEKHMEKDLEMLSGCDMLYLIETDGTSRSRGCHLEIQEARRLGMTILFSSRVVKAVS